VFRLGEYQFDWLVSSSLSFADDLIQLFISPERAQLSTN
jgi:hypothetical protein